MTIEEITTPVSLKDIPLAYVLEYLDDGDSFILALTCKSSLVTVQAVHKGAVPARSLRYFFPPGGALFNNECDSLMW